MNNVEQGLLFILEQFLSLAGIGEEIVLEFGFYLITKLWTECNNPHIV